MQGSAYHGLLHNSVTDEMLRDSAALSVIGNATGSTGPNADIVAPYNGDVLMRSGGALSFGQQQNLDDIYAGRYHPDRAPLVCAMQEEYPGGVEQLDWDHRSPAQNSPENYVLDHFNGVERLWSTSIGGGGFPAFSSVARWVIPPSGSWCAAMKLSHFGGGINQFGHGMGLLETGTVDTPTAISMMYTSTDNAFGRPALLRFAVVANYNPGGEVSASAKGMDQDPYYCGVGYILLIYDDSTKLCTWNFSFSGLFGADAAVAGSSAFNRTLGAAPVAVGSIYHRASATTSGTIRVIEFFRLFNDGVHNAPPYLIGADLAGN